MIAPQPFEVEVHNPEAHKTATLRVSNAGFAAIFELFLGHERIAYANCAALNTREYMLCDLRVGADAALEEARRHRFSLFRRQADHRQHGWGSLLLEEVAQEAQRSGFGTLVAEVTPTDEAANRDLLGWYERHGFTPSRKPASEPHWKRLKRTLH